MLWKVSLTRRESSPGTLKLINPHSAICYEIRKKSEEEKARHQNTAKQLQDEKARHQNTAKQLQDEKARHQNTAKQLQDIQNARSAIGSGQASYPRMLREFPDRAPAREAVDVTQTPKPTQAEAFRFHDNHGEKVVLSNNKQTAEFMSNIYGGGIVMSRDPVEVNKLYEVHITKRGRGVWSLQVGVVTSSPDSLTLADIVWGWESAVVVHSECFSDRKRGAPTDIGQALLNLPAGSRVGVSVDGSRRLLLNMNGVDQGVIPCRSLPDQCWALWQLDKLHRKITSLPVRDVS